MRKTSNYILVAIISILLFASFAASRGLLPSGVTLPCTGTISPGEVSSLSYVIYQSAGTNYIQNVSTGMNVYSSSSVASTFSAAFGYVSSGGTITVRAATYTATAQIRMTNCNNVKLVFEKGAILTISNNVNAAVLLVSNSNNCNFTNLDIDGNGASQDTSSSGIVFYLVNNSVINNATITNCRRDGFEVFDDVGGQQSNNDGIINSTITFCGWNGITLEGAPNQSHGQYAINNDIAYCGDVGISIYAEASIITGNYVHDMNGTSGSNNARWGIAVEDNGHSLIANNTLDDCLIGVCLSVGSSSLVINNNITNCDSGIFATDLGYNIITQNNVTNWGTTYSFGIALYYGQNNIASFNRLISNSGVAIFCHSSTSNAIFNNAITTNIAASSYGVLTETKTNTTIIKGNNIQAKTGITISDATCNNNKITQNTLGNCTTAITNSGTGTIINPSSPNSYTFTLNNPSVHGSVFPSVGTHSYSNTSQVLITLTPNTNYNSALNVDGVNVNLTDNTYTLSMNSDHAVYAIFSTSEGKP
jgi:hypothetical protein